MSAAILVIEDEAVLAKNILLYLQRLGYEVEHAATGEEGLERMGTFRPEVVVLDFQLPDINGLEVMQRIRREDNRSKVIIITGHGSEQVAVDAMKAGAYDYLSKPIVLETLRLVVDKAVSEVRLTDELTYYRTREARESGLDRLIGNSAAMTALKRLIRQVIESDYIVSDGHLPAVLISGATGTGKQLIARAVHFEGPRREAPFVELNCAAIPAHLLEAELFGYERGAFTDAKERKPGLIETAGQGTLFLDEISDLDLALQSKLLKLLEDRTMRRLGSVREQKTSTRFIATTNRNLEQLAREGKFRADLYFRLRIIQLEAPALAGRADDIALLAHHFLALHGLRYGKPQLRLAPQALGALQMHSWPGNVRELRNIVEQAVVLAQGDTIDADALAALASSAPAQTAKGTSDEPPGLLSPAGISLGQVERDLLLQALSQTGWNVTRAAKLLGITRDTLRYRMEKFGLRAP